MPFNWSNEDTCAQVGAWRLAPGTRCNEGWWQLISIGKGDENLVFLSRHSCVTGSVFTSEPLNSVLKYLFRETGSCRLWYLVCATPQTVLSQSPYFWWSLAWAHPPPWLGGGNIWELFCFLLLTQYSDNQSMVGLEPDWWGSPTGISISQKYQICVGASVPPRAGTLGSDLVLKNQALTLSG